MFVGASTAGWISDRIGRKRALIATTVWYSVFSLCNAFAWDVTGLFVTRLLTGVGLSAMTVVAITYISEMFPASRRGTYQAWIMTIGLCGIPVTAYVARFIVPAATWGWRAVFVWGSLGLLFPLFAHHLEESPLWFESHGRLAEADEVLARMERQVERETGQLLQPAPGRPAVAAAPSVQRGGFGALAASGSLKRLALLVARLDLPDARLLRIQLVGAAAPDRARFLHRALARTILGDADRRRAGRLDRRRYLGSMGAQDADRHHGGRHRRAAA